MEVIASTGKELRELRTVMTELPQVLTNIAVKSQNGWEANTSIAKATARAERELEILKVKAPNAPAKLAQEVVAFVQELRGMDLFKLPGIAETIDWADALTQLDKITLDPETIDNTLGVLLKYQDDIAKVRGSAAAEILDEVKRATAAGG